MNKLEKLEEILNLLNESITREEFVSSFENVAKMVVAGELKLSQRITDALADAKRTTDVTKHNLTKEVEKALKEQEDGLNFLYDRVSRLKDGKKGDKGERGESIQGPKGDKGDQGSPDSPEQVRDKLETLLGEDRLDASAIKNLPENVRTLVENTNKVMALYQLLDVAVAGIQTGQSIQWDGTKWIPYTPGGGSAANIKTEVVTATQDGADINIDISQLSEYATFGNLVLVMRNQIPQTFGITYAFSDPNVTIFNADAGESFQITYTYT